MKEKPVILIVDDKQENIELLEAYLVSPGYKIITASSGEEALEKLFANSIDLILLDVMMPGMDGFEVIRSVRENDAHKQLPIILVTALKETEDRVKGFDAGCDDFLSKPIDKMELLARVRSLLKLKAYNDLMLDSRKKLEIEVGRSNELLQKTLQGSIKILTDILVLINPGAYNTAQRTRKMMHNMCDRLQIEGAWEYEIAAMLSQIGLSTLPAEITDKYRNDQGFSTKEMLLFKSHPSIAQQLIKNIPRLEGIAEAIGNQMTDPSLLLEIKDPRIISMAQMLSLVIDFVIAEKKRNGDTLEALYDLKLDKNKYDSVMMSALEAEVRSIEKDFIIQEISPQDIALGMILADDIVDEHKMIIVPKGTEMTEMFLLTLSNFIKSGRKISKIWILTRIDHKQTNLS